MESASECDSGQIKKEEHLSASEGTSVNSYTQDYVNLAQLIDR